MQLVHLLVCNIKYVYSFTADSSYGAGLSPLFITLVKFPFHFKRSKCCL